MRVNRLQAGGALMPGTVLIVEDDTDGRQLLGLMLSHHGFRTLEAEDGAAALDVLTGEHPCVILLDLRMPVMDGFEFRERQLADPALRSIPVVVVSAEPNPGPALAQLQPNGYVSKPVDLVNVLAAVRTHCEPACV